MVIVLLVGSLLLGCQQWDDEPLDCATNPRGYPDGTVEIDIQCRHEAVFAYLIFQEYYETEICYGPSNVPNTFHCQSRAKIDGEWKWLKMSQGSVFTSFQDPFNPTVENIPLEAALTWFGIYLEK